MRIRRLFLCEKPKVGRQIAPLLGSVSSRSGCLFISNGDVVTWTAGMRMKMPRLFFTIKISSRGSGKTFLSFLLPLLFCPKNP